MILRAIINIVRLTWGFEPIVLNEIDETVAMVMMFGAFIDILASIGIITLIINAIAAHNRVAKKCMEVK